MLTLLKNKRSWTSFDKLTKSRIGDLSYQSEGEPKEYPCLALAQITPSNCGIYRIVYYFIYRGDAEILFKKKK